MSIDSTWLRCPNCFLPLSPAGDRTLGCESGHRYDLSRHGTVSLLPPRAPHTIGDSREMLEARARLLGSGVFDPIADAIVTASGDAASRTGDAALRVADLGCGTGYYASRLAEALPSAEFLAADRSPVAVRMAARAVPRSTSVVLDLWRPLPLRDSAADLAINVFAPRNPREFARVLRRDGVLVLVVPTARHLGELRRVGGLLDIPAGKDARVSAQLVSAGFSPSVAVRLEYSATVDAAQRAAIVGMGPSAHHTRAGGLAVSENSASDEPSQPSRVTVSVDVLAFLREPDSS
ncbi:methyltransferase domain-containing protein [Agromyces sp. NPDC058484]|uniref:methyltransferase domain-containing protein n=1 Tax=Agromyces sp. NPDC058484 TaxID=3346524 RepID=UPI003657B61A